MKAPLQSTKTAATTVPAQRVDIPAQPIVDNRLKAVAQRKMQEVIDNSPRQMVQRQAVDAINNSPRMVAQRQASVQLQTRPNRTGLPDKLKAGIESLSGHSLDDVQVHYNSAKPAQLQAHAYAQGAEIYVAPGQEKHLPHEAWHVVQQKQGRVRATTQLKGVGMNDDSGLEKEADVMGARAAEKQSQPTMVMQEKGEHNLAIQNLTPLFTQKSFAQETATNDTIQRVKIAGNFQSNSPLHEVKEGVFTVTHTTNHTEISTLVNAIAEHLSKYFDEYEMQEGENEEDLEALEDAQKIVILTGCHGDTMGNLIYNEDNFAKEDAKLQKDKFLKEYIEEVVDMQGLSQAQQIEQMKRTDRILILSWCYSDSTYNTIDLEEGNGLYTIVA